MRIWIGVLALLALAGIAAAEPMPDFRLPNELNQNVSLSDLLGKGPVLIDFWADYCQPCKQAMPALNELALAYDSLRVVLISLDAPKMQQRAKNYLKGKDFRFITLFDPDKTLAQKLKVVNPPHTFILDPGGEIVYEHLGYEAGMEREYELQIRSLLGLPAGEEAEECPGGVCPVEGDKEGHPCED